MATATEVRIGLFFYLFILRSAVNHPGRSHRTQLPSAISYAASQTMRRTTNTFSVANNKHSIAIDASRLHKTSFNFVIDINGAHM